MSTLTTAQSTLIMVAALVPLVAAGGAFLFVDFRRLSRYLRVGPVVWLALMPALGVGLTWLGSWIVERDGTNTVTFGRPEWLYALLGIDVLVLFLGYAFLMKGRALARFAHSPLAEMLTPTVAVNRQFAKACLLVLGAFGTVIAIAQPQWGRTERQVRAMGRDVMILLDVSKSMLAEDLYPNRLERAKIDIRDLASELQKTPGFRVGLIAFAGRAVVKCPLTLDYGYFVSRLDELGPESVGRGGTLIGDAIRRALRAFTDERRGYKDIILITDGEDHESFPVEAAKQAREKGVPIHAIGLGDPNEGRRIPVRDKDGSVRFLTHDGQEVWSKMQDKVLREIAGTSGGSYAPARTRSIELDRIFFEKIAVKEQRETTEKKQERQEHRYQIFLAFALALLLIECFVVARGRAT